MGQCVATVTGNISAKGLGVTLPHEHIVHRMSIHSHNPDNTCTDADLVAEELGAFLQAGGRTVCDVTPVGVGHEPRALKEVSRKSGVLVVAGIGLYQPDTWTAELKAMSRRKLADFLVSRANGNHTGIRCGLIGEVASHNETHADWRKYRLREEERQVFQAAADAQHRTGLSLYTHASLGRGGVEQLRTIIDAGGEAHRVIIGHCDSQMHRDIKVDVGYYRQILAAGACLGFDLFGWEDFLPDKERFRRISMLVQDGYTDRILLSTDTCRLSQLHRFGGRGFDYLFTTVLPGLRETGVSEKQLHQMTVTNPARMLAISSHN